MKTYTYQGKHGSHSLLFKTRQSGNIDCREYSLIETLYAKKLQHFSFEQRIEILNSYLSDSKSINASSYCQEVQIGNKDTIRNYEPDSNVKTIMVNLSSNDYLLLSQHEQVKNAVEKAAQLDGLGSGSSPLITGTTKVHRLLEQKIAQFKGTEDAMLFSSGSGANISTIRALLTRNDAIICDRYAHTSLMDGCTYTNLYYFKHNDIESLSLALKKAAKHKNKLVIVDGVYSLDGEIAPLDQIVATARNHGAWVLVDDAHATGVIGKNGRGTTSYFGLTGKVDILSGSFSKALGAVGGFVAGSKELIGYLRIACRAFTLSTASAVPVAAGVIEALNILDEEPFRMRQLHRNIHLFKTLLTEMGFNIGKTETAIIPLIIGNDYKVKEMTYRLHQAGILVNAVPYPTVPKKLTRVLLSLTSELAEDQIDYTLQEIERIATELRIIGKTGVHVPYPPSFEQPLTTLYNPSKTATPLL